MSLAVFFMTDIQHTKVCCILLLLSHKFLNQFLHYSQWYNTYLKTEDGYPEADLAGNLSALVTSRTL